MKDNQLLSPFADNERASSKFELQNNNLIDILL